jgi:hypothetical protein
MSFSPIDVTQVHRKELKYTVAICCVSLVLFHFECSKFKNTVLWKNGWLSVGHLQE